MFKKKPKIRYGPWSRATHDALTLIAENAVLKAGVDDRKVAVIVYEAVEAAARAAYREEDGGYSPSSWYTKTTINGKNVDDPVITKAMKTINDRVSELNETGERKHG